jgi:hypothetical protein
MTTENKEALNESSLKKVLRACLKTEGLTLVCADEADFKNRQKQEQRRNTGILPHSTSLRVRMTTKNKEQQKSP